MKNKASLSNLPSDITIDILSRLPIKAIPTCKCVCRKWLELLSSSEFAEMHFSRSSTPGLVVYQAEQNAHSCKIVEFVDVLELGHHDLHYNPLLQFNPTTFISSTYVIMLMASINGLLCLHHTDVQSFDDFYVCNPITREYITLPRLEGNIEYPNVAAYGMGVGSSSGQYKLVRINHGPVVRATESSPSLKVPDFECWVYTMGTEGSWRSIDPGSARCNYTNSYNGVFLNGNLHWVAVDEMDSQLISRFDLEMESFEPFPLPRLPESFTFPVSLSVLWDRLLCFCDSSSDDEIVIWAMKDYGDEKSWTKEFVISKEVGDLGGLTNHDIVYPIKVFEDGEILFLWERKCLFYYSSETETTPEVEMFKVDHSGSVQAMLHTSSFLSLNSFAVENVASF